MRRAGRRLQASHPNEGLKVTLWWLIHEERKARKRFRGEDEIRRRFRRRIEARRLPFSPPHVPHLLPKKKKKKWWDTAGAAEFWQAARRCRQRGAKINLTRPNTRKVPSVAAEEAHQIGTRREAAMTGRTEREEGKMKNAHVAVNFKYWQWDTDCGQNAS